ncbi:MAG: Rrf2 family transcriptional regulator [Oscillospiraceae bacterium]|nr:Rrf2 family transcriptional regulator [Oscillospiraceae bacterium]
MRISTKGRYAIRLMIDIAQYSNGGNVSLKDVSRRQGISLKYLEQIVNMLSKAGFLRSQRGSQGGYRMVRKPEEYTIGDILRITEGELAPVSCLEGEENTCPRASVCPTISFWEGLYDIINKYLDSKTVADLINESHTDEEDLCYYI